MTEKQKQALKMMAASNTAALLTRLGWTWPQDVRESDDAAAAIIETIEASSVLTSFCTRGGYQKGGAQ
jgi:hypothetical protein